MSSKEILSILKSLNAPKYIYEWYFSFVKPSRKDKKQKETMDNKALSTVLNYFNDVSFSKKSIKSAISNCQTWQSVEKELAKLFKLDGTISLQYFELVRIASNAPTESIGYLKALRIIKQTLCILGYQFQENLTLILSGKQGKFEVMLFEYLIFFVLFFNKCPMEKDFEFFLTTIPNVLDGISACLPDILCLKIGYSTVGCLASLIMPLFQSTIICGKYDNFNAERLTQFNLDFFMRMFFSKSIDIVSYLPIFKEYMEKGFSMLKDDDISLKKQFGNLSCLFLSLFSKHDYTIKDVNNFFETGLLCIRINFEISNDITIKDYDLFVDFVKWTINTFELQKHDFTIQEIIKHTDTKATKIEIVDLESYFRVFASDYKFSDITQFCPNSEKFNLMYEYFPFILQKFIEDPTILLQSFLKNLKIIENISTKIMMVHFMLVAINYLIEPPQIIIDIFGEIFKLFIFDDVQIKNKDSQNYIIDLREYVFRTLGFLYDKAPSSIFTILKNQFSDNNLFKLKLIHKFICSISFDSEGVKIENRFLSSFVKSDLHLAMLTYIKEHYEYVFAKDIFEFLQLITLNDPLNSILFSFLTFNELLKTRLYHNAIFKLCSLLFQADQENPQIANSIFFVFSDIVDFNQETILFLTNVVKKADSVTIENVLREKMIQHVVDFCLSSSTPIIILLNFIQVSLQQYPNLIKLISSPDLPLYQIIHQIISKTKINDEIMLCLISLLLSKDAKFGEIAEIKNPYIINLLFLVVIGTKYEMRTMDYLCKLLSDNIVNCYQVSRVCLFETLLEKCKKNSYVVLFDIIKIIL